MEGARRHGRILRVKFFEMFSSRIMQVNFIKICQTNKILVTASRDGSFCIWDIVQVDKKYIPSLSCLYRLGKYTRSDSEEYFPSFLSSMDSIHVGGLSTSYPPSWSLLCLKLPCLVCTKFSQQQEGSLPSAVNQPFLILYFCLDILSIVGDGERRKAFGAVQLCS